MPFYAFYCLDGENGPALRERFRAVHFEHLEAHRDDFALAGPLQDGDETLGSLLVIKADDEVSAREKFEADPYFAAGVWQSIRARKFDPLAGDWAPPSR